MLVVFTSNQLPRSTSADITREEIVHRMAALRAAGFYPVLFTETNQFVWVFFEGPGNLWWTIGVKKEVR